MARGGGDLADVANGLDDHLVLGPEGGAEDTVAEPGGVGLDAGREGLLVSKGKSWATYAAIVTS